LIPHAQLIWYDNMFECPKILIYYILAKHVVKNIIPSRLTIGKRLRTTKLRTIDNIIRATKTNESASVVALEPFDHCSAIVLWFDAWTVWPFFENQIPLPMRNENVRHFGTASASSIEFDLTYRNHRPIN